jgi:hypothetical protein
MANRTLMRCATAAALAAALSLVAVTTSSADPRWGTAAAVGTGAAIAVGAVAAAAASPYYNSYGAGYYDYDPDAVVAMPAPGYSDVTEPGWSYAVPRPGVCRFSIRGC